MTEHPLVSLIVPVHNNEAYIGECIESILRQSYDNLELIVVDDGSTDNSLKIISNWQKLDHRIIAIHQENQGPSAARNAGLEIAKGEIFGFIDGDDMIDETYVETLCALMHETDADISACFYTVSLSSLGQNNNNFITINSKGYLTDVLYQRFSDNSVWGKLFKSELWNDLRFKHMRFEDLEIFPRVTLKASNVVITDAKLYFYRQHNESFINTFTPLKFDVLAAIDCIECHFNDNSRQCSEQLLKALKSRRLSAAFNVFLITYKKPEYYDINALAWQEIINLRIECLRDKNVKLKLKTGIVTSFGGKRFLNFINKLFQVSS